MSIKAFFVEQLNYLADNGYSVTVICSPDDNLEQILGKKIEYIPVEIVRGVSPVNIVKTVAILIKIFRQNEFDIVQYSTPNAALCASIAGKLARMKIRNYHLMGLRYLGESGLKRIMLKWLEKVTCDLSTDIECVSKSNLELAISASLFNRDKAIVVWNGSSGGVDLQKFDYGKRSIWRKTTRKNLGIDDGTFLFGFVGRITRDKGINEILRAFKAIDSSCMLLIIGDCEGVDTIDSALWQYAEDNKNIIIHEFVSDIEKYYAAMDTLLLPSYREGFGMVIAEAAAMGTPAIVSDIPGPIDVIDNGKTAITVQDKDVTGLEEAMKRFSSDRHMVEDMSKNCHEFIKQEFDSKMLCKKILERKDGLLAKYECFDNNRCTAEK